MRWGNDRAVNRVESTEPKKNASLLLGAVYGAAGRWAVSGEGASLYPLPTAIIFL